MTPRDSKAIFDGFTSLEGGQDSGRAPHLIRPNQAARMVNITIRGGYPVTRPAWKRIPLTFPTAEDQAAFEDGRFQGASTFRNEPKNNEIVASIDGRMWRILVGLIDGSAQALTSAAQRNSTRLRQAWMEQVEETLVIQDGQSKAWLYNGGSIRRAEDYEVPVGTAMAYSDGRLWVAMPNGRDLLAGDLLGTDTGPLQFTENTFLNEGGAFQVPGSAGHIVAVESTTMPDTSLGEGGTLVLCENAAYVLNPPYDREVWKATSYLIFRSLLLNAGGVGPWSNANVNSDIFFRSPDGIRSVIRAQRDFGNWGNTPVSNEVEPITSQDSRFLLKHCSSVLFNNRLLTTYGPVHSGNQIVHAGLIVLEFDTISGMHDKVAPGYAGTWNRSDVRILKVVTGTWNGTDRCFVLGLDSTDKIGLWEITRDAQDERFDDGNIPITSIVDSRAFNFGNEWSAKRLSGAEIWTDRLAGTVSFTAEFRPDQYETECDTWRSWHSWSVIAPYQDCVVNDGTCQPVVTNTEQYRPRKKLGQPTDETDSVVGRPYRVGNEFQVRLTWTGHARIKRLLLKSYEEQETTTETIT